MLDVKEEFIALILELLEVPEDDREKEILDKLDKISPDPEYLDYVFHSDEFENQDGTIDIEAYVEKVFSYKPIIL